MYNISHDKFSSEIMKKKLLLQLLYFFLDPCRLTMTMTLIFSPIYNYSDIYNDLLKQPKN